MLVREVLVCREAHGLPFPHGLTRDIFHKIVDYNTWEFHTLFGDPVDCYNGFNRGVKEVFELLHAVTTVVDKRDYKYA